MIIQQRSVIEKSMKGLFLQFSHLSTGSYVGNHYDMIVDSETIPFNPIVATPETTTTSSILSGTKSEPSHPHPKSKQCLPNLPPLPEPKPEQQQEFEIKLEPAEPKPQFVPEEEFEPKLETEEPEPEFTIPNTPDSTTPEPSMHQLSFILHCPEEEFIPPPAICRRKWAKSTIDMSTFSNVTPEVVDRIPDGDHIYLIRCEEDYWHDKQINGHPWRMTKCSCKCLEGIKNFGTCRGSFICLNDDCPIYTAEHIRNRVDFMKEKCGVYSCSNCKVFVQRRQCNA